MPRPVKRLYVVGGIGWSFWGVQIILYSWGISFYAPTRWLPSLQLGEMWAARGVFQHKRIGPQYVHGFLLHWLYYCVYWPERRRDA